MSNADRGQSPGPFPGKGYDDIRKDPVESSYTSKSLLHRNRMEDVVLSVQACGTGSSEGVVPMNLNR